MRRTFGIEAYFFKLSGGETFNLINYGHTNRKQDLQVLKMGKMIFIANKEITLPSPD